MKYKGLFVGIGMDGVLLEMCDQYVACHINDLTDELKICIRNHLQNICYGEALAAKGMSSLSYRRTLSNFRNRYDEKTEQIKKGMIGELLTHLIIHEFFDKFDVASPFFNMEEKSQRKGFDLLLIDRDEHDLWITEVKSGELNTYRSSDSATRSFLQIAKRDLKLRLNQPETTFWLNAINTANNAVLECKDYKDAVLMVLDLEATAASDDESTGTDNCVILVSVLFNDINDPFEPSISASVAASVADEGIFKKVISFSIQKSTYQKIETFLFTEELNGNEEEACSTHS